jgi:hypothetical protein
MLLGDDGAIDNNNNNNNNNNNAWEYGYFFKCDSGF